MNNEALDGQTEKVAVEYLKVSDLPVSGQKMLGAYEVELAKLNGTMAKQEKRIRVLVLGIQMFLGTVGAVIFLNLENASSLEMVVLMLTIAVIILPGYINLFPAKAYNRKHQELLDSHLGLKEMLEDKRFALPRRNEDTLQH